MIEYEITITEKTPVEGEKYPANKEIYTQTIAGEYLDLQAIIQAVNSKFNSIKLN